ncbi:MAG: hypothetical protein ACOZAL_00605 [Patescibacteria group bacterium]
MLIRSKGGSAVRIEDGSCSYTIPPEGIDIPGEIGKYVLEKYLEVVEEKKTEENGGE